MKVFPIKVFGVNVDEKCGTLLTWINHPLTQVISSIVWRTNHPIEL